ncbi:unnamed protein product [Peniophora sp. CBMAI 1063]|nr:unnamed protein product [Peniophora sp. CBMAI 1063]
MSQAVDDTLVMSLAALHMHRRTGQVIGILHLPDDVLKIIVELCAGCEPAVIGRYEGWIRLTWVCRRLRYVVISMPRLFAENYTEYPGAQGVFRIRAGDQPLCYHVSASRPRMSKPIVHSGKEIRRMTHIRQSADFAACSQIWIIRRGDVVEHLKRLMLFPSLTKLEEIRASIEYEQQNAYAFVRDVNSPSFTGRLWAPHLLRAYFESCWLPIVAAGLRLLHITWDPDVNTPCPSAMAIHRALISRHASTLEDLQIRDALASPSADLSVAQTLAAPSFPRVQLPHLHNLVLVGCPLSYVRMLGALVIPSTAAVQLGLDCEEFPQLRDTLPMVVKVLVDRLPVPTTTINAVRVVVRQTQDGLLDVLVSGAVVPRDAIRLGDWHRPKTPRPALDICLLGVDTQEVEWADEIVPILRKMNAGISIDGIAFDLPDWCFTEDEVDWVRLFECVPAARTVRPLERIIDTIEDSENPDVVSLRGRLAGYSDTSR